MSNDEIAVRNADQIERLPYEILKSMFPSVRYFVDGEVWVAKGYFSKENKYTRKRETVAMGEWQTRCNARAFPNPIQATQWAELNVLHPLPLRLRTGLHQDGEGAESFSQFSEDFRRLRTTDVLSALRARNLRGSTGVSS